MKINIVITLLLFTIGLAVCAQTTSDVYHYGTTQNFGTARFQSLGGAFGALGGDLSAISQNPAASAVFKTSSGGLTVGSNRKDYNTNYFNTTIGTDRNNLVFDQIGAVIVLESPSQNIRLEKISLSVNYQLENDFRNNIVFNGNTPNSFVDYLVGQANGIPSGVLERNGRSDAFAYEDIGFDNRFGRIGQQAYFGFQSFLYDPTTNNDSLYASKVNSINNPQEITIENSGSQSKISLNAGFKYGTGFHWGVNLNIHNINQSKRTLIVESNDFATFGYTINEEIFGPGVSVAVGTIYTIDKFRLGINYQTPTWYELTAETDEFINVDYTRPIVVEGQVFNNIDVDPLPEIFFRQPDYGLRTPGKLSASAAYVIGKKGLISAQYDRQNLANTRYDSRYIDSNLINTNLENTFKAINAFRFGAEARAEQWRFRAGANFSTSPYRDNRIDGKSKGFSLGIGYDWGRWKLDGAYARSETNYNETPFENNDFSNSGNIDLTRNQLSITVGVNF